MKDDMFANECKNPIIITLVAIVILASFSPQNVQEIVNLLFFFTLGGLCLYNFSRCGRAHCRITGIGFVGVGVIALLNAFDVLDLPDITLWIIFVVVAAAGYGSEFAHKNKTGSRYCK